MLALLASLALADTITLDTGAVVEGDLARYELGGDCQVSVTEGPLSGVILITPCHRVLAFVRAATAQPRVLAAVEPVELGVAIVDALADEPTRTWNPEDAAAGDPPASTTTEEVPADVAADRSHGDATVQPRAAPSMPAVTTRPLSF